MFALRALFFFLLGWVHVRATVLYNKMCEERYVCKQTRAAGCSHMPFVLSVTLWGFNLKQSQVKCATASVEESQIYSMQKLFKSFILLNCTNEMFARPIFVLFVLFQEHCESYFGP